jgi:ABC-2 type transport system ATP-binding protein
MPRILTYASWSAAFDFSCRARPLVHVIQTESLVKRYGKVEALKGVSLSVERGEIFGLLGQNGAGKTTLIKTLLGIIKPTHGRALLLDRPAGTATVRRRIGYLPEDHRLPDYHTGASLLDFYGALLGVSGRERRRRIPEVLELVGLKGRMHSKIRNYSKGMKQRLGLAQAILHDPEVIFLDEPTDGVDPVGRREIRDMMQALKRSGMTIFINSHLLGEVELVCDRVAILQRGNLVQIGEVASLTRQEGRYTVGLAPGEELPRQELMRLGYGILDMQAYWEIAVPSGQTIDPVIALLQSRGLRLRHLIEKRQTLEELFIETVEGAEPGIDRVHEAYPYAVMVGNHHGTIGEERP